MPVPRRQPSVELMRPMFEKVTVPEGASWAMLNRRLDDGIPFQWHYHPEFELTLTSTAAASATSAIRLRPMTTATSCCSARTCRTPGARWERLEGARRISRMVMWFTAAWSESVTDGTCRDAARLSRCWRAPGAASCSRRERRQRARPIIETIPARAPADRLIRLMEVLTLLAADTDWAWIAGPGADRLKVASPDQARVERVLDHIHAHYRERSRSPPLPTSPRSAPPDSIACSGGIHALPSTTTWRSFVSGRPARCWSTAHGRSPISPGTSATPTLPTSTGASWR